MRADKSDLDSFATDAVLAALRSPQLYQALARPPPSMTRSWRRSATNSPTYAPSTTNWPPNVASGALSPLFAVKAEPQILAGIAAAEKREQELLTPSVLTELIAPGEDVAHRWDNAAVSTKREVARLLFSAEVLGELRLSRSPIRGRRCPIEQRLHWWKP